MGILFNVGVADLLEGAPPATVSNSRSQRLSNFGLAFGFCSVSRKVFIRQIPDAVSALTIIPLPPLESSPPGGIFS